MTGGLAGARGIEARGLPGIMHLELIREVKVCDLVPDARVGAVSELRGGAAVVQVVAVA